MKLSDIPQLTQAPTYHVDIPWVFLEDHIARLNESYGFDMQPEFQRAHVWTKEEQTAYVEYCLRGGQGSSAVYLNGRRWGTGERHKLVLVDGLQRVTAVLGFLRDEVPAFGHRLSEFDGKLSSMRPSFDWYVNNLSTMDQVVQWYIELNSTGRPHTQAELDVAKACVGTYPRIYEYRSMRDSYLMESDRLVATIRQGSTVWRVAKTTEYPGLTVVHCQSGPA